jgi:hypothetical protein
MIIGSSRIISTPSALSSRRIVSAASIADPEQDSAGGIRVWASNEKSVDQFANNFMEYVLGWIWPNGVTLDWVQGREGETTLEWSNSYITLISSVDISPQEAILTMKNKPIAARSDGCLQIEVHDPATEGRIFWSRQYYVLPLEVCLHNPSIFNR